MESSGVINKIEEFKENVIVKFKISSNDNNIFDEYKILYEKEDINDLNFLETGFWDLTFQNSFYIDNKLYFYDQEWRNNKIPLEFILYRNIEYLDTLKRRLNIQEVYTKLGLTKYLPLFKQLDDKLQEEIRDTTVFTMYIAPMTTVKGLVIENGKLNKQIEEEKEFAKLQESKINAIEKQLQEKQEQLDEKQEQLNIIANSRSWKILTKIRIFIYKIKNKFKSKGK